MVVPTGVAAIGLLVFSSPVVVPGFLPRSASKPIDTLAGKVRRTPGIPVAARYRLVVRVAEVLVITGPAVGGRGVVLSLSAVLGRSTSLLAVIGAQLDCSEEECECNPRRLGFTWRSGCH